GAVAKGAFEAGVLQILAKARVDVMRIVAASAGSLNGVVYAAGIAAGHPGEAAEQLVKLWTSEASWRKVFHINLVDLFVRRDGISDEKKLLEILREHVTPVGTQAAIDLRILVSPLGGRDGNIGAEPATTYEYVVDFDEDDFTSEQKLAPVFE